jgi:hypothetical protein
LLVPRLISDLPERVNNYFGLTLKSNLVKVGLMASKTKKPIGEARFVPWNHPLRVVESGAFGFPRLYDWQAEVVTAAADFRSRVCVSCCNEAGKTNILIPLLGLSFMCAFPGGTCVSTSGVEEQIRGHLFKYLDGYIRKYLKPSRDGWNISLSDLTMQGPDVWGLRSRWIGRAPKDALTLEGYHSHWKRNDRGEDIFCPVMFIIDEAKTSEQALFEAVWRIDPDFLLVVSTFGPDSGPFFEAMEDLIQSNQETDESKKRNALWTYRRKINWTQCPHLLTPAKKKYREAMIEKYGENSSFIKSFLGGDFMRGTDKNYVFLDHDIRNVRRAMGLQVSDERIGNVPILDGNKRAGLEFSGGGDEQIIYIRNGTEIIYWQAFREPNTVKLAKIFVDLLEKYGVDPWACYADNGGLGLAVIDSMEAMGYQPIYRYMNQQTPLNRHEYADKITEDHWAFKNILSRFPCKLPNDPVLLKQMRQRLFVSDDHNRVKMELKRGHRARCGESPDRLDAIIMTWSDFEPPRQAKPPPKEYVSELEEESRKHAGEKGAFSGMIPQDNLAKIRRMAENNA